MSSDLLNQFNFPAEAQEFVSNRLSQKTLKSGVSEFEPAGHEGGLAYRFFLHPVKDEMKSEAVDMDIYKEVEMVQVFRDKMFKPCHRVTHLPDALLRLAKKRIDMGEGIYRYEYLKDEDGNYICKGGRYADAYKRFKEGLTTLGLPLERWGHITLGEVATLKSEGVFTVQQFAALPVDRVQGVFPKNLVKAFNDAIHFVNAEDKDRDVKQYADALVEVKQELAQLRAENETLRAQPVSKPKKKPGRPRKKKVLKEN